MIPSSTTVPPCGEESQFLVKSGDCVEAYGALEETEKSRYDPEDCYDSGHDRFIDENDNLLDNPDKSMLLNTTPSPPDGGWGWVVVAASFFCLCVLDGISYTFGMFLAPLMEDMECGRGGVSAAGSFQVE